MEKFHPAQQTSAHFEEENLRKYDNKIMPITSILAEKHLNCNFKKSNEFLSQNAQNVSKNSNLKLNTQLTNILEQNSSTVPKTNLKKFQSNQSLNKFFKSDENHSINGTKPSNLKLHRRISKSLDRDLNKISDPLYENCNFASKINNEVKSKYQVPFTEQKSKESNSNIHSTGSKCFQKPLNFGKIDKTSPSKSKDQNKNSNKVGSNIKIQHASNSNLVHDSSNFTSLKDLKSKFESNQQLTQVFSKTKLNRQVSRSMEDVFSQKNAKATPFERSKTISQSRNRFNNK